MRRICLIVVLLILSSSAYSKDSRFSVAAYMGLYQPDLRDLNQHEFKSPVSGTASTIVGTGEQQDNLINFANPLPEFAPGVNAGLEFLWKLNDKYDLIVGGGTWEATSRSLAEGDFYLQGQEATVVNERTAKLSYNEFYFGFRRNLITSPKRFTGYYRLTLNEVFDIDYREDLVFLYTSGDAEGVKKSIILQSQATGQLMFQPGFGFDYKFNDLISVGFEASYVLGFRRVTLRDGKSENDFQVSDNLNLWLPQRIDPLSGDLQYLSPNPVDNEDYSPIKLSLDGWKMQARISIHF